MRTLILGAGASKPAGYPLANELLSVVGKAAISSHSVALRNAWTAWETFRSGLPIELQLIAANSNPEIALTLPDLMALAIDSEDEFQISTAVRAALAGEIPDEEAAERQERYFASASRGAIDSAKVARRRLLDCLDEYFWLKHFDDLRKGLISRAYLKELLSDLKPGDTIITFNWDTLVERTLGELRMWSPIDGYGFSKELQISADTIRGPVTVPIPDNELTPSDVHVLKLHGSFGWIRNDENVVFDDVRYLDGFPFKFKSQPLGSRLVDPEYDPIWHSDGPGFLYPSFLKGLEWPVLQTVWRQAAEVLSRADTVDIFGYSLPPSDVAARALLHVLGNRTTQGHVQVSITDPKEAVLLRWKQFLGEGNVRFVSGRLGDESS